MGYLVKIASRWYPLVSLGSLEETDDPTGLGVESDFPEAWTCAKARHGLHIAKNGV